MNDIYIDERVYALTTKTRKYIKVFLERPLPIVHFKAVSRIMVSELDLGDYQDSEMKFIKFFVDSKCGCNHEVTYGDAFLMPLGEIYMIVPMRDAIENDKRSLLFEQCDKIPLVFPTDEEYEFKSEESMTGEKRKFIKYPGKPDWAIMTYASDPSKSQYAVSRFYPKNYRK